MFGLIFTVFIALGVGTAAAAEPRPLPSQKVVSSVLEFDDQSRRPQEQWVFTGKAGEVIEVQMRAPAFEGELVLSRRAEAADVLTSGIPNDENHRYAYENGLFGQEGLTRVFATLPEDSEYLITATSWRKPAGSMRGRYSLLLKRRGTAAPAPQAKRLALGTVGTGELTKRDPLDHFGDPYHLWRIDAPAGSSVRVMGPANIPVKLVPGQLRNAVFVAQGAERRVGNYDVMATVPEDGVLFVKVVAERLWWKSPIRSEHYRLTAGPVIELPRGTLERGKEVHGTLTPDDACDGIRRFDDWELDVTAGESLAIEHGGATGPRIEIWHDDMSKWGRRLYDANYSLLDMPIIYITFRDTRRVIVRVVGPNIVDDASTRTYALRVRALETGEELKPRGR